MDGAKPDVTDPKGWTALMLAAVGELKLVSPSGEMAAEENQGHSQALQLLIKRGANPALMNEHGDMALHLAAFSGRLDCVKALVGSGVNPWSKNGSGQNILQLAREEGLVEQETWLLTLPGAKEAGKVGLLGKIKGFFGY